MNVKIIGDVMGQTGYSSHTKQLALALSKHVSVQIECNKYPGWELKCKEELIDMINIKQENDVSIFIGTPDYWQFELANKPKKFIGFLIWECAELPVHWIDYCNDERVDQIWCPSKFVKDVAIESGVDKDKLFIVPHGVDLKYFSHVNKSTGNVKVKDHDEFTFLWNKGWSQGVNDRSGFDIVLKAFSEEFDKEKDNVQLIAKLNSAYLPPEWDLHKEIGKLGIDLKTNAPIKILIDNMPFPYLRELYIQSDVMVCPTKGEAFGLTMLESMACGVPVITSNFGGQCDFVTGDTGWLLPTKLIPATDKSHLYESCNWGIINKDDLKKLMRKLYENPQLIKDKIPKTIEVANAFTWEESANKAFSILLGL